MPDYPNTNPHPSWNNPNPDPDVTATGGWCAPSHVDLPLPFEFTPLERPNPSKALLDLLQDAYDAGADPDLDFNDYLHHAITGGRLHLEVL